MGYLVAAVVLIFASCAALAFLQLPREVQAALLGFGIVRLAVFFLCRGSTMRAASAVALVPAFMLVIAVLLAMMTPALFASSPVNIFWDLLWPFDARGVLHEIFRCLAALFRFATPVQDATAPFSPISSERFCGMGLLLLLLSWH